MIWEIAFCCVGTMALFGLIYSVFFERKDMTKYSRKRLKQLNQVSKTISKMWGKDMKEDGINHEDLAWRYHR